MVSLRQELHDPVIYYEYCSRIKGIDDVQTNLILVGRPQQMALPWLDGKCSLANRKQSFVFFLFCGKRCFINRSRYVVQGWMQAFTLVTELVMVVFALLPQVRIFGVTQSKYTAMTCNGRRRAHVNLSENRKHSLTQSMDYHVTATLKTKNICNMYASCYLNWITSIIWVDKIYYKHNLCL